MIKLYFESTSAYITSLLQYFTGEANILNGSPKWRRSRDVYRTSAGPNHKTINFLKSSFQKQRTYFEHTTLFEVAW